MPIIKSAKKKMRQDTKKQGLNKLYKNNYKQAVRKILSQAKQKIKIKKEDISKAYSAIDKAVKKNIIHKNRAARIKARIGKLLK